MTNAGTLLVRMARVCKVRLPPKGKGCQACWRASLSDVVIGSCPCSELDVAIQRYFPERQELMNGR